MSTWIIIQARTGSQRWPKKVLHTLPNGDSVIANVIRQCKKTGYPVAVAIPVGDIELLGHINDRFDNRVPVIMGDASDLVDRYRQAAHELKASRIVRATGDCPFIFPQEIKWIADECAKGAVDFGSNGFPEGRTVADGCDVECFSMEFLQWLWGAAKDAKHKEHLPTFVYDNLQTVQQQWKVQRFDWPVNLSGIKFSLDKQSELDELIAKGWVK